MNELEFIKHMQILELKENDIIVLRTPFRLSAPATENLSKALKKISERAGFGNIHFLLLEENVEIGLLRKEVECES